MEQQRPIHPNRRDTMPLLPLSSGDRVLFLGDSITDAGGISREWSAEPFDGPGWLSRISREVARQPELQVELRIRQPGECSRLALFLFRLFDAAEGATRGKTGLFRAHALREELVLQHLQVRSYFARQLGIGATTPEKSEQSEEKTAQRWAHVL